MQEQNIKHYNMGREEDYYYNKLYNERAKKSMVACFYSMMGIILLLIFSLLFSSCKNVQYIPVERVVTEYINRTDTVNKTDTLISEKETIIREADSSLIAKLGLQLKENERAILVLQRQLEKQISKESEHKTDTVIKTDTIQVPYPVERTLTKWEQVKMDYGAIAIGGCITFVIIIIIGFIVRAYRKT
jgi:hypothetical protein